MAERMGERKNGERKGVGAEGSLAGSEEKTLNGRSQRGWENQHQQPPLGSVQPQHMAAWRWRLDKMELACSA